MYVYARKLIGRGKTLSDFSKYKKKSEAQHRSDFLAMSKKDRVRYLGVLEPEQYRALTGVDNRDVSTHQRGVATERDHMGGYARYTCKREGHVQGCRRRCYRRRRR